jgi:hypothetical protein
MGTNDVLRCVRNTDRGEIQPPSVTAIALYMPIKYSSRYTYLHGSAYFDRARASHNILNGDRHAECHIFPIFLHVGGVHE